MRAEGADQVPERVALGDGLGVLRAHRAREPAAEQLSGERELLVAQALEELGVGGVDLDPPRPRQAGGIPEHRVGALGERGVGAAESRGARPGRHLEEGEAGRIGGCRRRGTEDQDEGERQDPPRVVHGISGIGR